MSKPLINNLKELIDIIYPIGSVYISVNSTSPETLFGGSWTQLKDRFLLGAGSTYTNGNTGGSATHTNELNYNDGAAAIRNYSDTFLFGDGAKNVKSIKSASSPGIWQFKHETDYSSSMDYTGVGLYGKTGEGSSMPPYLVVNMWKRTG
jgi:hypothetical protein